MIYKAVDSIHLPFEDNLVESISCKHVIEHIGLGRYGDPLDYDGDLNAARELTRVTATGGYLLIVVPIGRESKIHFNAHRIFRYDDLLRMFPNMVLQKFSLIPDKTEGGLIRHADRMPADKQEYACGCFLFKKSRSSL